MFNCPCDFVAVRLSHKTRLCYIGSLDVLPLRLRRLFSISCRCLVAAEGAVFNQPNLAREEKDGIMDKLSE